MPCRDEPRRGSFERALRLKSFAVLGFGSFYGITENDAKSGDLHKTSNFPIHLPHANFL